MTATDWDDRYRAKSTLWSGDPNPQLVAEVSDVPPGRALDAPTGEGGDAIWLAQRGWTVTAVDFSRVALDRAAAAAQEVGAEVNARIEWRCEDLTRWDPPRAAYDLVSVQFLQIPKAEREAALRRAASGVAPRGWLLVVGHHPSDLQTPVRRPRNPEFLFTPEDIIALLDPRTWEIVTSDVRPRTVELPDGGTAEVRDSVVRARRRE
jgi:SAM-dependent methyltransferase